MPSQLLNFLLLTIFTIVLFYFAFPRQFKNAILAIIPKWRREFVVVHFKKLATQTPLTYYVLPDKKTGMGEIDKGTYDLHKDNALPDIPLFKKRLHFLVTEGNPIPEKAELNEITEKTAMLVYKGKIFFHKGVAVNQDNLTVDRVKLWAFRVNSAFKTQAYDFIYGEKRQWAFIIAVGVAVISIIVMIYAISEFQRYKPLVEAIYQNTIVGNETMIIKKK